jgi:hypothetical protein
MNKDKMKQHRTFDKLEEFIQNHRADFDIHEPDSKLWKAIELELPQPAVVAKLPKLTFQKTLVRVAAAAAILIMGVGIGFFMNEKIETDTIAQAASNVGTNLSETEAYYVKRVNSELVRLENFNPDPAVMSDMKQLDGIREELKRELQSAPLATREEIIQRLVENYQAKLGILERVLKHLEHNTNAEGAENNLLEKTIKEQNSNKSDHDTI